MTSSVKTSFKALVQYAASGKTLSADQMTTAMTAMLQGEPSPVQMSAFLIALKMRGEHPTEIAAAASAMREKAYRFTGPENAIDTCGTGGDGVGTWNISTAVAFVLAGCGIPVAKHGNKAVSSLSGSSDILAHLGVKLEAEMNVIEDCLNDIGISFLFAQRHHPSVKHVAPIRADIGVRTLFNLLGPLTNPAGAKYQLLGVYDRHLTEPIANVLKQLGSKAAWVVHGSDGLDELTLTGPSFVSALDIKGDISSFEVSPEDAGLKSCSAQELIGGNTNVNADAFKALLKGERNAYRDIVLLNAAAGLKLTGNADDLKQGVEIAAAAIDTGKAAEKLHRLIEKTNA